MRSLLLNTALFLSSPADAGTGGAPLAVMSLSKAAAAAIVDRAGKVADALSEDTMDDIADYITSKQDAARGPVTVCIDLQRDFGDEILNWPTPGSKESDTNNPDKFTLSVVVDGDTKKKPASFYSLVFDSTKRGKRIAANVAAIDAAEKGSADAPAFFTELHGKEAAALYASYKRMTKAERTAERARETQDKTNARGVLVKAVKVTQQMARINSMEKVGVRFFMVTTKDEDGVTDIKVLKNTPKPIVIYDKTEAANATPVSVDTFLSYDVDTAKANGGTMGDLTETAGRDGSGGTPQAGGKGQVPRITSVEQFEGYTAEYAAYLQSEAGKANMLKSVAGKNPELMIQSLCEIADALDSITTKLRPKYEAILEAKATKAAA